MKKTAIALLTFAVAIFAASCQKENITEQGEITSKEEGMTISAVSEGIGAGLKADLAYKYDVIWRDKDEICVKNSTTTATFTLVDGAGTTKGTFSSATSITGEVEGFYPASVANLVWPAEQQNNQVPPMYCKKNLTSTQNQTFNFNSLGSVLQLAFNSTTDNITVKSIKVSANEAMSGAFTINEGKAVISQPEGDKPGITLDLGEGVAMGTSAKYFNIAIPSGTYSALSIVLTATDGQICTINAKKPIAIEHNMVYKLTISGEFKADVPADGVQLWKDGPYFAKCNIGASTPGSYGGYYSFDEAKNAAKSLGTGWRLPSESELQGLIDNCDKSWETKKDDTGADRNGYLFTGKGDYSSNSIFLPAAGYKNYDEKIRCGEEGYYCSSSVAQIDFFVRCLNFTEHICMNVNIEPRYGMSVRAVWSAK